jgi:hypothetical protein
VLAIHESNTVCDSPDSAIVVGEFVALLTTLTLPDALPSPVGANLMVNVAV